MSLIIERSWPLYFFVTCLIGGGAAFMSGRSMAQGWRPLWHMIGTILLLGWGIRFLHFSLFGGTLTSLHYYLTDTATLLFIALMGFRLTRTQQMVTRYHWLYRKTGPFTWVEK